MGLQTRLQAKNATWARLTASPEALATLEGMDIALDEPGSQPLTAQMVDQADHVFVMTESHRRAATGTLADKEESHKVQLLDADGHDIPDPLGGPPEIYWQCAARIRKGLQKAIAKVLP